MKSLALWSTVIVTLLAIGIFNSCLCEQIFTLSVKTTALISFKIDTQFPFMEEYKYSELSLN